MANNIEEILIQLKNKQKELEEIEDLERAHQINLVIEGVNDYVTGKRNDPPDTKQWIGIDLETDASLTSESITNEEGVEADYFDEEYKRLSRLANKSDISVETLQDLHTKCVTNKNLLSENDVKSERWQSLLELINQKKLYKRNELFQQALEQKTKKKYSEAKKLLEDLRILFPNDKEAIEQLNYLSPEISQFDA
jgi:multidrug resistance efflux pump